MSHPARVEHAMMSEYGQWQVAGSAPEVANVGF